MTRPICFRSARKALYIALGNFGSDVKVLRNQGNQVFLSLALLQRMPELSAQTVKGIDRFHVPYPGTDRYHQGFARDHPGDSRGIADEKDLCLRRRKVAIGLLWFLQTRVSCIRSRGCSRLVQ